MSTVAELLQGIVWRESTTESSPSVGTFKECFSNYSALLLRKSKTNARRASIIMQDPKDPKKSFTIICSDALTPLVREEKLGMEEIAGFPIFKNEKGIFVGLPSDGWVEVSKIVLKAYKPTSGITLASLNQQA